MRCPSCEAEVIVGARFCPNCGTPVAPGCRECGAEVPPEARFCPSCGAAQTPSTPATTEPGEELKVISVLFCDLVGFTAHSERNDPEAVRERLTVYHTRVRADVERFGGRVEKLMGDGVFAVFGAPSVHEDDPERAVRAALRIQESMSELNEADPGLALEVRVAVTTGEAVLQMARTPDREGIVGDVVNTASRLQQVAPVGGVVVDERTFLALRDVVEFEAMAPVEVKGKSASLSIWRAIGARSRFGVAVEVPVSEVFVGRTHELGLLTDAMERAEAQSSPQLVTIVGEPGVGKSRLVHELYKWVDDRSDIVWWRQGRCLPYGEGITFWALGEIVKSQAGILEAEPPEEAAAKLKAAVTSLIDDPAESDWVRLRLGPLVGIGGGGAERSELFNAWRRFFEALASRHPLVMVIEDLHWADEALLEFLEYLLDWTHGLPLLLVCTARPELYASRPDWGGGRPDAVNVGLGALNPAETVELVAELSHRSVMPARAQQALLERSGGNPLYVTEYVRLASERGLLDRLGEGDLPLPDTIQSLLAARFDLMTADDKAVLHAASVVGKVFWTGAVSFLLNVDFNEVTAALGRMTKRDLIRPVRRSSMFGQDEFSFAHVLARDVAYGQIPKRERAALHEATARWLEARAEGRLSDVADQLAHHYGTAFDLGATESPELRARAYRFVMLAAERAATLDGGQAAEYYQRAVRLASTPTERGRALLGRAENSFDDTQAALSLVEEARNAFIEASDREGQIRALNQRSSLEWFRGESSSADRTLEEALRLTEDMEPSEAVAEVLTSAASAHQLRGREEQALDVVERALAVAQEVGSTEAYARALVIRGSALTQIGDFTGEDDVVEGLRIVLDLNVTQRAMNAYNNHATFLIATGQLEEGLGVIDEAIEYGTMRGLPNHVDWSNMTKCEALFPLGRWDELIDITHELVRSDTQRGGSQVGIFAREWQAVVLFHRGETAVARSMLAESLSAAREIEDPQAMMPSLAHATVAFLAAGEAERADQLAEEFVGACQRHPVFAGLHLPTAAQALIRLGRAADLERLAGAVKTGGMPFIAAQVDWMRALARGDSTEALATSCRLWEISDSLQNLFWATMARAEGARRALELGEIDEAIRLTDEVRSGAEAMGARRLLDELAEMENNQRAALG